MAKKAQEIDVNRLCSAMARARLALRYFRTERRDAVKEYVGRHWSEEGTRKEVPVNLISLFVNIVGRNLVPKAPRVMLSTFDRSMKPIVGAMESWANREIKRSRFKTTLERVVTDALFSVGICKVALATPADAASLSWSLKGGQPYAARVDLDDFVFDIHARDFSEVSFIGHRYRVPLATVKDDKRNYKQSRKDLSASQDPLFNTEGDERLSVLGRSTYGNNTEEFEDMVDLWEIYLPRHRCVLTLADDYLSGPQPGQDKGKVEALREQNWLGPDSGPYHILSFNVVPGNAMPKAPIQDLRGLHDATNVAYRKVQRMSERTKEITAVRGKDMEDANRINDANDGETVAVSNPDGVKQIVFGGTALQQILLVAQEWKALFSWAAGNLDMIGGLSPQSKTLGQDKMLDENASRSVADMQDTTIAFTSDVLESLCWYWHHDPFNTMKTKHSLPGMPDMEITRKVTPEQRMKGKFEDLDIAVDPYSMQRKTPQSAMAMLDQIMTQVFVPMAPLLQQQGIVADFNAYLQKKAKYGDMPDLMDIATIQEPPQDVNSGPQGEGGMPAQTERTYTRENIPMRSETGHRQDMQARLLGQNLGGNPQTSKNGPPQPGGMGR